MTINVWGSDNPVQETKGGTAQSTYAKGDILYASAANTLSKLAIGADGKVLTLASGLPSWATATSGSATINTVSKTLSNSEIKALNSTPVQMVAAQGSGTVIFPMHVFMRLNAGSEALATGGPIYLVYSGTTDRQCRLMPVAAFRQTTDQIVQDYIGGTTNATYEPTTTSANTALDVTASADFTGNASNDATIDVVVQYTVITL